MPADLIENDTVVNKIYFLRGEKVLLDVDLALLYGVETKRLKEAVRRNINRFPADFMFRLSQREWSNLRSQFASSSLKLTGRTLPRINQGREKSWGGQRYPSFAFTEQGVAMLSGILNSPRAIETNIAIMRTFVALRKWMKSNKALATKIRQLESKYDKQFNVVFEAIRQLLKEEKEIRPLRTLHYKEKIS